MRELEFQRTLIKELKNRYPGICIMRGDALREQGIPDLFLLYGNKWAALECKKSMSSTYRPNQEYKIDMYNKMSFCSMICPENREEVLNDLERAFRS